MCLLIGNLRCVQTDLNSIVSSSVTDQNSIGSLSYPCFYSLVNIYAPAQRRRYERTMGAVLRMIDVDTRAV